MDANRLYGFTAQDTLSYAQALYEATWPPGVVRNGTSLNAALIQSKSTPFP